jgi:hypothetical protein
MLYINCLLIFLQQVLKVHKQMPLHRCERAFKCDLKIWNEKWSRTVQKEYVQFIKILDFVNWFDSKFDF